MKYSLIAIVFALLTGTVIAQDRETIQAEADSLVRIGEFENSIVLYNDLINNYTPTDIAYRGRGYAYLETNRLNDGEADFNKALSLNPECSNCYSNLSRISAARGDLEKAMKQIDKSIELDPKNDFAYFFRGILKDAAGKSILAKVDFNKAIQLNPNEGIYYQRRGEYYLNSGYIRLALDDMDKAIFLDPANAVIYYSRARVYIAIQSADLALEDLEKCTALDSSNAVYFGDKGTVLSMLGRDKEALSSFDRSILLDSTRYLTYMNRAFSRYNVEDMDGACEDFEAAYRWIEKNEQNAATIEMLDMRMGELCNPEALSYYYQRGIAAYNLGDYEEAVEYYNEGLRRYPESPMLISFTGNAYKAMGADQEALQLYRRFFQHQDKLMSELGANERFSNEADIAMYKNGSIASVYGSMAESCGNLGMTDEAMIYIDSAIILLEKYNHLEEMKEILSVCYNTKGVLLNIKGDYEGAKKEFTKAIASDKKNPYPHMNTAWALLIEHKMLNQTSANISVYFNSGSSIRQQVSAPVMKRKKADKEILQTALNECDKAIELNEAFAYAYMLRAEIKILLGEKGYCLDVLSAEEKGIPDAAELLGVNCK